MFSKTGRGSVSGSSKHSQPEVLKNRAPMTRSNFKFSNPLLPDTWRAPVSWTFASRTRTCSRACVCENGDLYLNSGVLNTCAIWSGSQGGCMRELERTQIKVGN